MLKWKFSGTKKNITKSTCLLDRIMTIGERRTSILLDEAFVVKSTHDNFVDLGHKQLMLLRLKLGHVLTSVSSWRQNINEKIVCEEFFSRTFGHLSDSVWSHSHNWCYSVWSEDKWLPTWFEHSIHIRCEWYFFVYRIEKVVILGIIRQIEQRLESLHIRVQIIGFHSIEQRIGVFVHHFEAISKPGFYFVIMKFVENNFW